MTTLDSMTVLVEGFEDRTLLDDAQLAAAAYLARYSARLTPTAMICGLSFSGPQPTTMWGFPKGR